MVVHQSCDQAKECAASPKSIYFVFPVIYNKSNCAGHHPPLGLNFLLNFPRMNPQLQEWLNYANNHFDIMDQQMCIEHQYIGYSLMISNNYHTSFATVAYMTQWDNWSKYTCSGYHHRDFCHSCDLTSVILGAYGHPNLLVVCNCFWLVWLTMRNQARCLNTQRQAVRL